MNEKEFLKDVILLGGVDVAVGLSCLGFCFGITVKWKSSAQICTQMSVFRFKISPNVQTVMWRNALIVLLWLRMEIRSGDSKGKKKKIKMDKNTKPCPQQT